MVLPRPRLTVRRLMIAVALAGLALGGWIELGRLSRLSGEYARRADSLQISSYRSGLRGRGTHEQWVEQCRAVWQWNRENVDTGLSNFSRGILPPPEVWRVLSDHDARLERKYRRAARYPWLFVEPDPPAPNPRWSKPEDRG